MDSLSVGITPTAHSLSSRRAAAENLPPFTIPQIHSAGIPRTGASPSSLGLNSAGSTTPQANSMQSQGHYTFGHSHGSWPTPAPSQPHMANTSSTQGRPIANGHQHQQHHQQQHHQQPLSTYDGRANQFPQTTAYMNHGAPERSSPSPVSHHGLQQQSNHGYEHHAPFSPHGQTTTQHSVPFPGHQLPSVTQPQHMGSTSTAPTQAGYGFARPPSASPQVPTLHSQYQGPRSPLGATAGGNPGMFPGVRGSGSMQLPYVQQPMNLPHHAQARPPPSLSGQPAYPMTGGFAPSQQMGQLPGQVAYSLPHNYLYNPHAQGNGAAERPFKCNSCPQAFSRNHDLKRHKRIHLAVKPYPCTYCDKQFSRKDALKRHRLVKGCEQKVLAQQKKDQGGDRRDDDVGSISSVDERN